MRKEGQLISSVLGIVNDWCNLPDEAMVEILLMVCNEVVEPEERVKALSSVYSFVVSC